MRVAWFGGTFDPPHRGHLRVAVAAADAFKLDIVLFSPTGRQPMKPAGASASFKDRLQMVTLTCAHDRRFEVSTLDAPRADARPNFTVDVLTQLRDQYPSPSRLFAIIGADGFMDLPNWRDSERLFELAEWIVVSRPGFGDTPTREESSELVGKQALEFLGGVHEDISATALRRRLACRENCDKFLLPEVSAYIQEHHLYQ